MSGLRRLERSVIMNKSYKLCGGTAMFDPLWKGYCEKHRNVNKYPKQIVNSEKQVKKDKSVLRKVRDRLFGKNNDKKQLNVLAD